MVGELECSTVLQKGLYAVCGEVKMHKSHSALEMMEEGLGYSPKNKVRNVKWHDTSVN
jgi:hypothetical protein